MSSRDARKTGADAHPARTEARAAGTEPPSPEAPLPTRVSEEDLYLFNAGEHFRLYEHLGSHPMEHAGREGTYFAVWAPNADSVSVIGHFNGWRPDASPLRMRGSSGIWEGFLPGILVGELYKYHIRSRWNGYHADKSDPFGVHRETPPRTANVVWDLDYAWGDAEWMAERGRRNALDAPISVYEVHLGSWRRVPEESQRWLTYRELASELTAYVKDMGFTHVELMPLAEHPFYGSWGYQTTGFFAPTSRYGTPQDLMYMIDRLHQAGIGVILDWVPSHFPTDEHGPGYFDGTHLYEHDDPRQGFHPDWRSFVFNYGRNEVRSFLISSALYWLSKYHVDALRVDAVASMLYLDYSRSEGEWIPNVHGGRDNLEAIGFLRRLNEEVYRSFPDVQTIAEESTAWPLVSRPVSMGGLGFGLKWDMGWMHDTLRYFQRDPVHRPYHHDELTFRSLYAFHENFVLPLSHDEVVYGKGSILGKMPGDEWQRFANLRLLLSYMFAQSGKKLVFMGAELGQRREWNHEQSLDWHLASEELHAGVQKLVRDLNRVYRTCPELHERDVDPAGFEWVDASDRERCVYSWLRRDSRGRAALIVLNATPEPLFNHRVGVPTGGIWREVLNSDAADYGGSGHGNLGDIEAAPVPAHGKPSSLNLTLPPLGAIFLRNEAP